jgi:hypothetical protein
VEARKIVAWGMLWAAILDYAMAESESAIKRLWFASLEAQQTFLLDVIAPNDEVRAYLRERWETHSGSAPAARSEVA